ncbi:hypothetical protein JCM12681A_13530 [Streptomyces mexicanus]
MQAGAAAPALAGAAVSAMLVPPATRVRAASIAVLLRLMSGVFLPWGTFAEDVRVRGTRLWRGPVPYAVGVAPRPVSGGGPMERWPADGPRAAGGACAGPRRSRRPRRRRGESAAGDSKQ